MTTPSVGQPGGKRVWTVSEKHLRKWEIRLFCLRDSRESLSVRLIGPSILILTSIIESQQPRLPISPAGSRSLLTRIDVVLKDTRGLLDHHSDAHHRL